MARHLALVAALLAVAGMSTPALAADAPTSTVIYVSPSGSEANMRGNG